MTLFEYVAVGASLVCSFAAVRLLGGIAAALQPDRSYWVHATWVLMTIFLVTLNWWLFWSYRDVEWNYALFLVALLPLAMLYVLGTLLIPGDATQITSWRAHYFEIRVRFCALNLAYVSALSLNTIVLLGHPVLHPRRILPGVLSAMFIAGLASDNPRLHGFIVLGVVAANLVAAALFQSPGSFGVAP